MKPLDAWDDLLRALIHTDEDERENAIFQIGLILERHNNPNQDAAELYEENLSRELLRLVLDEKRQTAAIVYLVALVKNQPASAESYLYALSKSRPALFCQPLLEMLQAHGAKLAPEAAFQAVVCLEVCLKAKLPDLKALLQQYDPQELLDTWAEDSDNELADKADRVLEKIEDLLGV